MDVNTVQKCTNELSQTKCLNNDLIPKILKFRIPSNGCFEETTVHNFQRRLLRKEIRNAKQQTVPLEQRLDEVRSTLNTMSDHLKRAVIHYSRLKRRFCTKQLTMRHQKKLENSASEQEKPLNKVRTQSRF